VQGRGSGHETVFRAYAISQFSDLAAVFYFSPSRAGEHSRNFLHLERQDGLDDFASYRAELYLGVTQSGCAVHARPKFFDLPATNNSQIAEKPLHYLVALYEVESLTPHQGVRL
jgi:transposase